MKKYQPKSREELKALVDNLEINLGDIDTSNITDMAFLFHESERTDFNGIEDWNVSKVKDMDLMFCNSQFNKDISNWNTSNVESMMGMFEKSSFNRDISKWNVSNVKNMEYMFAQSKFNQDISNWDVSNVKYMRCMFEYSNFNGDISSWNVSNVKNMSEMFEKSSFNRDISKWNTSNVEYMAYMFKNSNFNGDISKWNVSNVKNMWGMFEKSSFNRDISKWKLNKKVIIDDVTLSKIKEVEKMKRKKIIGYKVRMRGELRIEEDIYMIIWETVIRLPLTPYTYADSFVYFTRINNEIVIKIDTNENDFAIIKWNEYMKYRMIKLDKTNIKSRKPFIKFSSFVPYSEKFEILFTKYNMEIKEEDKIKIDILGIEETIEITESEYEFYKDMFTNFE